MALFKVLLNALTEYNYFIIILFSFSAFCSSESAPNMPIHTDNTKKFAFRCRTCGYQTTPENRFKMHQCGHLTIQKSDLNKRLNMKKLEKVDLFKCNLCEYQTIWKKCLRTHKCDQCEYKTIVKSHLKIHLLRHKNIDEANFF